MRGIGPGSRYAAHLGVLGAGLVLAALHGSATGVSGSPAPSYVPPAALLSPVPAAAVHTLGDSGRPTAAAEPRHPSVTRPAAHRVTTRPVRQATAPRPAPVPPRHLSTPAPTSFAAALDAAIARIPTYRPGAARWVVSRAYAFWGTADWYRDVLYVSPDVPLSKLYDVAVHEWSHELSVLDYGGDVDAATRAMNRWFGGSDLTGPERAADCMAVLQGATWTHYTTCTNAVWRAGAAKLLAGSRV